MSKVTRRSFVTTVGAATVIPAAVLMQTPDSSAAAPAKSASTAALPVKPTYLFFDTGEALFIEAACERLIPADESGPGALSAGVPNYLDKQLGGTWGAGERLYRSGPWHPGNQAAAERNSRDAAPVRRVLTQPFSAVTAWPSGPATNLDTLPQERPSASVPRPAEGSLSQS